MRKSTINKIEKCYEKFILRSLESFVREQYFGLPLSVSYRMREHTADGAGNMFSSSDVYRKVKCY
jgi:hypothetical protein